MSCTTGPKNDGKILVQVMESDLYGSADRFQLRVQEKHARIGAHILIKFEDDHTEAYIIMGILEPRP